MRSRSVAYLTTGLVCFLLTGCTFVTVRPATVDLGPSYHWQIGATTPVRPATTGICAVVECASDSKVSKVMPTTELGFDHGWKPHRGARARSLGLRVSGLALQANGYIQLRETPDVNYGIGARVGVPYRGH